MLSVTKATTLGVIRQVNICKTKTREYFIKFIASKPQKASTEILFHAKKYGFKTLSDLGIRCVLLKLPIGCTKVIIPSL